MAIATERLKSLPEDVKSCLEVSGVNVEFQGEFPDELHNHPISSFLLLITEELADNCMDKGAKNVYISLTPNSLRVEDDVIESDPERTLLLLNKIKDSKTSFTTKDEQRKSAGEAPDGGMGIMMIVNALDRFEGDLNYYIVDRKIVAEVTWK